MSDSRFDVKPNARGRYPDGAFIGGVKSSKGVIARWRMWIKKEPQFDQWGLAAMEADPSHPYNVLGIYETYVVFRTLAEIDRLFASAQKHGGYHYGCYYMHGRQRTEQAIGKLSWKLSDERDRIIGERAAMAERGESLAAGDAADEAESALLKMLDFE